MTRKIKFDPLLLAQIKREYLSARERSSKDGTAVIDKYAAMYGVDRSTIHRKLNTGICKRDRSQATQIGRAEIDAYALDVWNFQQAKSSPDKEYSTMTAYRVLRSDNRVPASVTYDQVYQSITRQRLRARLRVPPTLFEHGHPLSMLQVDYSVSRYFKVHSDGTVIMSGKAGYYQQFKKDDDEKTRLRVWMMCFLDDHSRVAWGEYRITTGEDASSIQRSLIAALMPKERVIESTGECITLKFYQGLPEYIYWDRGPGNTADSTLAGLEALGVKVMKTGNLKDADGNDTFRSNKRAHGKIENFVKDVKNDFEQFMWGILRKGTVLTLDALNEEFQRWIEQKNLRPHPRLDGIRWDLFEPVLATAKYPPNEALAQFGVTFERIVTNDGLISVGKNRFAIAPGDVSKKERVQLMKEHNTVYLLRNGRRELLAMTDGMQPKQREELPSDLLTGKALRDRLAAELDRLSDGKVSLGDAKLSHKDDINCFYEKPRTLEEVKALARVIVGERKKLTANIIIAQPQ
jgi:hypothetical protein